MEGGDVALLDVSTCESTLRTLILWVEMKRSTSVMGWGSPSGAWIYIKYTALTQLCHITENIKVQDRDTEVFSNTYFSIQTKETTHLITLLYTCTYLASVCGMLRLCRTAAKKKNICNVLQHQFVLKVDTTCEDTLLYMPSYKVNICKNTNEKMKNSS